MRLERGGAEGRYATLQHPSGIPLDPFTDTSLSRWLPSPPSVSSVHRTVYNAQSTSHNFATRIPDIPLGCSSTALGPPLFLPLGICGHVALPPGHWLGGAASAPHHFAGPCHWDASPQGVIPRFPLLVDHHSVLASSPLRESSPEVKVRLYR